MNLPMVSERRIFPCSTRIITLVVVATVLEIIGSIVWGAYRYRLELGPLEGDRFLEPGDTVVVDRGHDGLTVTGRR